MSTRTFARLGRCGVGAGAIAACLGGCMGEGRVYPTGDATAEAPDGPLLETITVVSSGKGDSGSEEVTCERRGDGGARDAAKGAPVDSGTDALPDSAVVDAGTGADSGDAAAAIPAPCDPVATGYDPGDLCGQQLTVAVQCTTTLERCDAIPFPGPNGTTRFYHYLLGACSSLPSAAANLVTHVTLFRHRFWGIGGAPDPNNRFGWTRAMVDVDGATWTQPQSPRRAHFALVGTMPWRYPRWYEYDGFGMPFDWRDFPLPPQPSQPFIEAWVMGEHWTYAATSSLEGYHATTTLAPTASGFSIQGSYSDVAIEACDSQPLQPCGFKFSATCTGEYVRPAVE